MNKKQKRDAEEPDCCFNCRSFSSYKGRKSFGYCMKFSKNSKPKDICGEHRRAYGR